MFFLLVLDTYWEQKKWFTVKVGSDVHDSDVLNQFQLITNIQVPLQMFLTFDYLLLNNLE
jgi:hypothetical protein